MIDRILSINGKLILAPLLVLLVAVALSSWLSGPLAVTLAAVVLPFLFAASYRWPRAMLVVSAIAPFADPLVLGLLIGPLLSPAFRFFSEGLLTLVGLAVMLRAWRQGTLLTAFRHPLTWWLAAFVLIAAASAVVNGVPILIAVAGVVFTVDAVALFYLPRMIGFSGVAARNALLAWLGVLALAATLAVGQDLLDPTLLGLRTFAGTFGEGARATAFFANPNMLGAVLGLGSPLILFAIPRQAGVRCWLLVILGFIVMLALVLTFSRAAWAATVVGFGAIALLLDRRALLIGIGLATAAVLTASVMPRNLLVGPDQLAMSGATPSVLNSTIDRVDAIGGGHDLRTRFLLEGIPIVEDHPVLGVGPGRYGGAAASIFGTPVYAAYGTGLHGFHTIHNFWLHLLGELGALGLLAFVGMLLSVGLQLVRSARRSSGVRFVLLAGGLAGAAVMGVHSGAEMLLEGNSAAFAFWFLLGLGSAVAEPAPGDASQNSPHGRVAPLTAG